MMGVFVRVNIKRTRESATLVGYILQENGCWDWVGARTSKGYGTVWNGRRNTGAHRFIYEQQKGPIAPGMTLDHLCRNRGCVNPDHLEQVTSRENILRGVGAPAQNLKKNVCKYGHPFDGTYLQQGRVYRYCTYCRKVKDIRSTETQKRRRARHLLSENAE